MNRPIKFRAFYKEYGDPANPHGTMFYDVIPCSADFKEWLISFDADGSYDGDFTVGKDIEIMQFTGLLDKNGKEIYEGDVVDSGATRWEIFWDEEKSRWGMRDATTVSAIGFERWFEVIGNVFEHPELLTKEV